MSKFRFFDLFSRKKEELSLQHPIVSAHAPSVTLSRTGKTIDEVWEEMGRDLVDASVRPTHGNIPMQERDGIMTSAMLEEARRWIATRPLKPLTEEEKNQIRQAV